MRIAAGICQSMSRLEYLSPLTEVLRGELDRLKFVGVSSVPLIVSGDSELLAFHPLCDHCDVSQIREIFYCSVFVSHLVMGLDDAQGAAIIFKCVGPRADLKFHRTEMAEVPTIILR